MTKINLHNILHVAMDNDPHAGGLSTEVTACVHEAMRDCSKLVMERVEKQTQVIEKENISNFLFPQEEVLKDDFAKQERLLNIYRGIKLGNTLKNKVEIIFEDVLGIKKVETTIWGATDNYIILKSNLLIPIHRIYSVNV